MNWRQKCMEHPNLMFGSSLRSARKRALKRDLPFGINREYIVDLFEKQEGRCHYSGIKLNVIKSDEYGVHDPLKMSLDCVDPKKGYVRGNLVWCAYCINSFKLKMPVENMLDICRQIIKRADEK